MLLWFVYIQEEKLFAIFFCINLITDILDGLIARMFNLQTKFGARLDSIADMTTFILAFVGILIFKIEDFGRSIWLLWIFIGVFLFVNLFALLKFKKWASLHLYSMKITGYIQGIFFFILFSWDYNQTLFYFAIIAGYLAWVEELIVLIIIPELRSNVKGLYWILRKTH